MSITIKQASNECIQFLECVQIVSNFCDEYNTLTDKQKRVTMALMRDVVR